MKHIIRGGIGLALLGLVACSSPISPTTSNSSAARSAATLYGYTTSGSVTGQGAANWATLSYNSTNTVENNDWGIPQNGQGSSTIFTETLNGSNAFGWAYGVTNGTNVTMYPEVGYGWSPNGNNSWGGSPVIAQLSENRAITTSFNITTQHGSSNDTWDLAYDIWITSAQHPSSVQGSYELMIWLDHNKQGPWANSSPPGNVSIDGVNYNKYTNTGVGSGWTVLSYINTGSAVLSSSSFNIGDVIKDAAASFGISSSYYVSSIEFGNEVVNGSGITEISNWSVNVGAVGSATSGSGGSTGTSGTTTSLPGQVQASNYSALTGAMKLEACSDTGGGQDVGYTSAGGTLQYPISVATTGTYTAAYRVASATGGSFDVSIDGTKVDTITVPNTGGWQVWTTINGSKAYSLSAGTHTLQITVDSISYNLNWIQFATSSTSSGGGTAANFSLNSWQYNSDQGVTVWNGGVGNFVTGNWIEFNSVNFSTGYNNFAVWYATTESGSFDLHLDSPTGTVIGTVSYGSTGSWNTYVWGGCNLNSSLAQGTHNLYLVSTAGTANLGILWIKNQ